MRKFKCYLKPILIERGLNNRQLADKTGLNECSISRYTNGERVPNALDAIKIANVLGVNISEIWLELQ